MVTKDENQATLAAHMFANVLSTDKSKLFNVTTKDVGEAQRQLRYAAALSEHEYCEIDLDLTYPIDIEEIFKNLPDRNGIIVIANYDKAHEYMVDLINFCLEYYEYRKMISSNEGIIPVSGKWKFVLLNRPGFRFDPIVYRSLYHFNFN